MSVNGKLEVVLCYFFFSADLGCIWSSEFSKEKMKLSKTVVSFYSTILSIYFAKILMFWFGSGSPGFTSCPLYSLSSRLNSLLIGIASFIWGKTQLSEWPGRRAKFLRRCVLWWGWNLLTLGEMARGAYFLAGPLRKRAPQICPQLRRLTPHLHLRLPPRLQLQTNK